MATKHTPGPWSVRELELYEHGMGIEIVAVDGTVIADNQTYYPHALAPENASLIASAPELLEMCKQLLPWVRKAVGDLGITSVMPENLAAVIAKAEGKE